MSPHQIVAVALRLFAVWVAIDVLRTLPSFYFARESDAPGLVYSLSFFALTIVIVLALWFFPRTIAGKLLSPASAEREAPASPDTWLAMGCALIGLWMLTTAVPALVFDVFAYSSAGSNYDETDKLRHWILYQVVEVLIALWLVFGARGFRELFWWARDAGRNRGP
jgi:hypothetical protein